MAFAERQGRGGVHDGVDADDIADRLDRGAIAGALGEDDMGHADAGEIGVGQGEEGAARFRVEDADVASDATVLKAGINNVADEVAGAAVAGLGPVGGVVEEDRLLVVEWHSFAERSLGIVVAVFGVWSRQRDVRTSRAGVSMESDLLQSERSSVSVSGVIGRGRSEAERAVFDLSGAGARERTRCDD